MKVAEIIDFSRELGERFPDMRDGEVLLAVQEFCGSRYHPDSEVGRKVVEAYEAGSSDPSLHLDLHGGRG